MRKAFQTALLSALGVAGAVPAQAQDDEKNILEGDTVTIGAGVTYSPSYDGSDDYVLSPLPAIRGQIGGITITPRVGGLGVDLIPDRKGAKIDFAAGPVVGLSFNRARQIKDPVVKAAGKLDMAAEIGVGGGITVNRVLHDYDWVTFNADVTRDVAGAYSGVTWRPSVSYSTPLSRGVLVTAMAYANHVDGKYARYYYSVSPEQSAASGLPEYNAKGGWDKAGIGTLVAWDLSGNILDGGWSLLGIASYSRMLNAGKDTPFTSMRGDPDQWFGGLGVAYTF